MFWTLFIIKSVRIFSTGITSAPWFLQFCYEIRSSAFALSLVCILLLIADVAQNSGDEDAEMEDATNVDDDEQESTQNEMSGGDSWMLEKQCYIV